MNTFVSFWLFLGLIITLILAGVAIFGFRSSRAAIDGPKPLTRFFLVALRLAIGWHFFVEGLDKLNNPSWSSEAYLREASGPLAPDFREMAGDRLIDKLTVGSNGAFPAELSIEWQSYLDAFTRFYDLNAEETKKAQEVMDKAKANTLIWLTKTPKLVQVIADYPPPLMVEMTIPERLTEYDKLEGKVRHVEQVLLPAYGAEAFSELKTAKANLNKWRNELKNDLAQQTAAFKQALRDQVLVGIAIDALPKDVQKTIPKKEPIPALQAIYSTLLIKKNQGEDPKLPDQAVKTFTNALDKKKNKQDPVEMLPTSPGRPMSHYEMLDWTDVLVKWGITLTGACLLLGLLTRTACVVGAGLLFMFFLAMPPLPGWPESPRAEGHYLYINKNIIEMLALLTLATTRSGRWVGLDSLCQLCCGRDWQEPPPSSNLEEVVNKEEDTTLAINPPQGSH